MDARPTCLICGKSIEAGEAWMVAADGHLRKVAHAGCVYRDEPSADTQGAWRPAEGEPMRAPR